MAKHAKTDAVILAREIHRDRCKASEFDSPCYGFTPSDYAEALRRLEALGDSTAPVREGEKQ